MKQYVVGFMFSKDLSQVALIRKSKPEWQRGKLNGVGGKREGMETSLGAMIREFQEETGQITGTAEWKMFCNMGGNNNDGSDGAFSIVFFASVGDLSALKTVEEEPIEIVSTVDIHPHRADVIENLPWLIALAIDFLQDGRPRFVTASYP